MIMPWKMHYLTLFYTWKQWVSQEIKNLPIVVGVQNWPLNPGLSDITIHAFLNNTLPNYTVTAWLEEDVTIAKLKVAEKGDLRSVKLLLTALSLW